MTDLSRVADRWDATEWASGIPKDYWSHYPLINDYINATIAPHAEHVLAWLGQNFLQDGPCERALSVCCGLGVADRQALTAGVCRSIEGFDISPASLDVARAEAARAGLSDRARYWVADANAITLEKDHYDLAICFGAMHHVAALEHVCEELRQALKPDSIIFINEYVGPARMQWTDEQLALLNRFVSVLPSDWCRTRRVDRQALEDIIAVDPSEAVRSGEVVGILSEHFELVEGCDYGGGLLMPLWESAIVPEVFTLDNRVEKQVIMKLLILVDEMLAEHEIVPSNYAQLVFRNRPPATGAGPVPWRLSLDSPERSRWVERWLPGTIFSDKPAKRGPLPQKAFSILVHDGPLALAEEVGSYLRWHGRQRQGNQSKG